MALFLLQYFLIIHKYKITIYLMLTHEIKKLKIKLNSIGLRVFYCDYISLYSVYDTGVCNALSIEFYMFIFTS